MLCNSGEITAITEQRREPKRRNGARMWACCLLNRTCNPRRLSQEQWTVVSSMFSTTTRLFANCLCNSHRNQRTQMPACTILNQYAVGCICQLNTHTHKICMSRTMFNAMATLHTVHMPNLGLHLGHGNILPGWQQAPRYPHIFDGSGESSCAWCTYVVPARSTVAAPTC